MSIKVKNKSITINAILNMFNTVLSMAFSLLTYPYASRVLQVENLGKVNYTASIVSYFVLFASLGFSTYAVREGSKLKTNNEYLNKFASQIFSFHFITSLLAYILLIVTLLISADIREYWVLIAIQSIAIINNWLSVNWINIIFEDYLFITIRSIVVQLLSIAMLYIFVKDSNDYYIYAGINVLSNFIVCILNFLHVGKYCQLKLTRKVNIKKHLRPVLVFFSNSLAVSIYLNSDTTMLGWMIGNYQVGLYTVAVKIYTTIRTVIAAAYNVAVARMARYSAEDNLVNFKKLLNKIINIVIFISIPTTMGLFCLSDNIIILLSGESYLEAGDSLRILAFAFLFAILGGVLAYCVNIPLKKEKRVLSATIISAVENIVLNVFIIPRYGIEGTAFTTLIAEMTVFLVLLFGMKKEWHLFEYKKIFVNILKCMCGVILFSPFKNMVCLFADSNVKIILVYFTGAVVIYFIIELILRNQTLIDLFNGIMSKKITTR